MQLYRNISETLSTLRRRDDAAAAAAADAFDHRSGAWMYILFVLTFYAFSIVILMIKYIRREREGAKLEYYYNEFVKRDWYKDKNLYDKSGRRIHYKVDGTAVTKVGYRKTSYYEDPEDTYFSSYSDEDDSVSDNQPAGLASLGAASIFKDSAATMANVTLNSNGGAKKELGARPKRRSNTVRWADKSKRHGGSSRFRRSKSIIVGGSRSKSGVVVTFQDDRRESVGGGGFETVPLAFLHGKIDKLMLTKADEGVTRVQSLPPRRALINKSRDLSEEDLSESK